jgi:DNA-directed RNA polymerase specialized sigma24 family protein
MIREPDQDPDLSKLTPAERDAYEAVYERGMVGREYARQTDRAWGTVSKLLTRAREKLDVFREVEET